MLRLAIGRALLWLIEPAQQEQLRQLEDYERWVNPPEGLAIYRRWFNRLHPHLNLNRTHKDIDSVSRYFDHLWAERAKRFLKAELKRADVTYEELARLLREHHGLNETKVSVSNKLSRGTFSAMFFLAAMKAIGRQTVNLDEV